MKIFLNLFLVIIALNACKKIKETKHPSFFAIEKFIKSEKRIKEFYISGIHIDRFYTSEYKRFKPNSAEVESRKLIASYDLTLKNRTKDYKSKAVVASIDSVNWKIIKIAIINQSDSIGKHFEETITWEYPNDLRPYHVSLKITDN